MKQLNPASAGDLGWKAEGLSAPPWSAPAVYGERRQKTAPLIKNSVERVKSLVALELSS